MLIQLLSTLLLLSGSAFGAGAGNNFNFQNNCNDHFSITAPASPKGAYYDPSGEYGNELGKIYNYTDYVFTLEAQNGPQAPITQPNGTANVTYSYVNSQSDPNYEKYYLLAQLKYQGETSNWNIEAEIDIYVNGVYLATQTSNPGHGGQLEPKIYLETNPSATQYIWLFNHEEEIPLSPESIFDVVGEATTASAGILGNGFNAMIALFYANGQVTGFGIICLILAGVGLVWFAWRLVLALFRRRA